MRWIGRLLALGLAVWCTCPLASENGRPLRVDIQGVNGELLDNVHSYLSIAQYPPEGETVDEEVLRRLHARAPGEIRSALQPFGYYSPEIDASLQREGSTWVATYRIRPGEPVTISEVDINLQGPGREDAALLRARDAINLSRGQILHHAAYANAKQRLLETAASRGYLDAAFTRSRMLVDPAARRARILLTLDTGPQFYFGEITFEPTTVNDSLLRRYLRFSPGDPYSTSKLLNLQYALGDSPYFSSVTVDAPRQKADAERRIPVTVETLARPDSRYTLGLGYGTDTGPRLKLGWEDRRVNRRGHHFAAEMSFSSIKRSINARYFVPLADPATEQLIYSAADTEEDFGDGKSRKLQLGISQVQLVGRWQQVFYTLYERERNDLSVVTASDQVLVPGLSRLIIPGVSYSMTEADNPTLPRRGYSISADLRGSWTRLYSDASFLRADLSARFAYPLGESSRLLMRGEVGASKVPAFQDLPLSQRFYAGGDTSVRGFAYNSLGPTDDLGRVIGGRNLLVGSVELDHQFVGNWGAAVFFDAGNAMNSFSTPLERAAGIGLRYRTPVGMLRLDLAHPVAGSQGGYRIHLSIGPDL
ncbi:MAG: autotransporter assembly complex family protein [Gammaproteobacteria bacterium]|jgi:translocation and assembly module TamA